ncbi:transcription termination factor NusA [Treponema phagedenis]|uniref:transcription termination factor NusA n=1 Tax=Treponema phagedenis TaxID=162 RepID=UPI0001F64009|nr:transcription termination factor NusA [Treponema phagedenis]EFW37055.1 transcription termination factor NusA [Treponema phagedenis F0421]TYT78642.1 transcription termination/antitermination protein NusA [Treponema phagedenis]
MFGVSNNNIRRFAQEKEMDEDLAFKIVEQTLKAAYKTTFKTDENAVVTFGDNHVSIYSRKKVVDEVDDDVTEIDLEDAKKLTENAELGDELLVELDPENFKRGSVQAAVQRIHQLSRELQKDSLYAEYKSKEGEIIIGYFQRMREGSIYVDLGKVEGVLPRKYQIPGEEFHQNDRIKALIREVKKHQSNLVQLILSRTDADFVRGLLSSEIPEIYDGIVEIHKIVREPGYRTKVAVFTRREDIDPVGACVGQRGARIQTIIKELDDEKIDVVEYSDDPAEFIRNALSPAEVLNVIILDEEKRSALAVVSDSQLSIAIGKQGLNVRLANRLADWSIDVKTEKQFAEMEVVTDSRKAAEELFSDDEEVAEYDIQEELPNLDPAIITILHQNGIKEIETLVNLSENEVRALEGMTSEYVEELFKEINENFEIVQEERIDEPEQTNTEEQLPEYEEQSFECPECGARITTDMTECPNCGIGLSFEYEDEDEE